MKTKNLIAKLILIVMVALGVLAIYGNGKVKANSWTDENGYKWYYTVSNADSFGYSSTNYVAANLRVEVPSTVSTITNLEIPKTIKGYPVVHIGSWDIDDGDSYGGECGFIRQVDVEFKYRTSSSSLTTYQKNYIKESYTEATPVNSLLVVKKVTLPDTITQISTFAFNGTRKSVYKTGVGSYTGYYSNASYSQRYEYTIKYNMYGVVGLESINFPKRLTTIGASAFYNQSSLNELAFETKGSLKTIGDAAFKGCSKLTNINFSKSITTIGNNAFENCTNLTSVNFVDNSHITTIGNEAFKGCNKLVSVVFNENPNLTTIGSNAFEGISTLISFDFSKLNKLTTIGNSAFVGTKLTSVNLTNCDNLLTIGANAFDNVTTIEGSLYIGNNLTTIGNSAFRNTKIDNIEFVSDASKKVTIGQFAFTGTSISSLNINEKVAEIERCAFSNCLNLTSVVYSNDCTLKTIEEKTYINDPITTLVLPRGVTNINVQALDGVKLTSITIPGTVKVLGSGVLQNASELETVIIEDSIDTENPITSIPSNAFYNTKLSSITIPDSITNIGDSAFRKTKFTSFEIPNTIETMGRYVFAECTDLETVTFENTTKLTTIPDYTFYNSGLNSITIPDEITSFGGAAFSGTQFTSFEIPSQITTMGSSVFANTTLLESVTFEDGSQLEVIPSTAFYKSGIKEIEIGHAVNKIGNYAFQLSNIESVIISADIETLESNVFSDCANLRRVEFTDESGTKTIGTRMFYNSGLEEIILPEGLETIADYAFYGTKITSFTLPSTVTSLGTSVFAYTDNLTEFNFPETSELTSIPGSTFAFSGIEEITIPSYITTIGDYAFNQSKIKNITIPNTVESMGQMVFENTEELESVEFEEECQITSFNYGLFLGSSVQEVEIPHSVTSIGTYCFKGSKIKNIVIPNSVTSLGSYAFKDTTEAESLEFEEGTKVELIPQNCFQNSGIKSVKFAEGIKTFERYSFDGCSRLCGDIVIPNSVTTLATTSSYGDYPIFTGCTSFDGDFIIGDGVQHIPAGFMDTNCTKLKRVILGTGVRYLHSYDYGTDYSSGSRVEVAYYNGAFPHLTKIYVKGNKEDIIFEKYWNCLKREETRSYSVLKYYEYVTLNVSTLPGVKLINTDTQEEIVTSTYSASTVLNYKVQVQDDYVDTYRDLKYYRSTMDGFEGSETVDVTDEIQTMILSEDGFIYILNKDPRADFALRTYLNNVNNVDVLSRIPSQVMENGNYRYLHTKKPYQVKTGDLIRYTFRVYNEGSNDGSINSIHVFIPEGLEYASDMKFNTGYGWVEKENGDYSTEYLKNKTIYSNLNNGSEKYRDVQILLRVTAETIEEDKVFNIIAEIEDQDIEDLDSEPGTITAGVGANYRQEERDASDSSSYIAGVQDDDDFESVVVRKQNRAEYQIKISKIDGSTKALLKGAKFNLINEQNEVVDTAYTDENGELTFSNIVTYGDKNDIYYIEEQETPEGYIIPVKSKVKVIVNKTSLNTEEGTYNVSMDYELFDYNVDTTKIKYMPITNAEQLKKIGSGEEVVVNGVTYTYGPNGYYQLLNDIELSTDTNWTPIEGFKGILEGNNHKISNLTYMSEDDYTDVGVIGLFGSFEGMIDSVVLDNVQIHVKTINTEKKTAAGHTGIGAFAGEMVKGTIQNCTVNGSISASTDNIGGFVGHTVEGNITNFINDTYNAVGTSVGVQGTNINKTEEEREATEEELAEVSVTEPTKRIYKIGEEGAVSGTQIYTDVDYVTSTAKTTYSSTASNIGGFVGCSLGSINMDNCTNNAPINTSRYNGAGLVGYINATDYTNVTNVKGNVENNVISFVLENTRTSGSYELRLASKDAQTLGLIEGGVYKVLDRNKTVIEGYENIEIVGNSVKIADVDIYNYGVDTYYIAEVTPADGYERMTAKVKIEITKYWDHEAEKFKVRVRVIVLTNEEYEADVPKTEENELDSYTGKTYEIETSGEEGEEGAILFKKKAKIQNSTNNGLISGVENPFNVSGLVANVQCKIELDGCVNNGNVQSVAAQNLNVSGGIAEISNFRNETSIIKNSVNKGTISTAGGSSAKASGLLTHAFTNLNVEKCTNEGNVSSSGQYDSVAGIVCSGNGHFKFTDCVNKGTVTVESQGSYANSGGIFGEIDRYGYIDWAKGDTRNSKYAEMLDNSPYSYKDNGFEFYNCINYGDINGSQNSGGIAGSICGEYLVLNKCKTDSLDPERKTLLQYCGTFEEGGLIGYSATVNNVIKDCELNNTNVTTYETYTGNYFNIGGLIGSIERQGQSRDYDGSESISNRIGAVSIDNCKVTNSNISQNGYNTSGMLGFVYYPSQDMFLRNCSIIDTTVSGGQSYDGHISGMISEIYSNSNTINVYLQDNYVENFNILNQYRGSSLEQNACLLASLQYVNYSLYAQNNTFKHITISSGAADSGCVFGGGYSYSNFVLLDNNTVDDMTIKMTGGSKYGSGNAALIGTTGHSTNYGPAVFTNNKVKNLEITSYINNSGVHNGGIVAFATNSTITLANNSVENFKAYQAGGSYYCTMGGMIGNAYISSGITASNNTVKDLDFTELINSGNTGSGGARVAGLIGYSGKRYNIDKCSVTNFIAVSTHGISGILSGCDDYNVSGSSITNCDVKDLDFTTYIGGDNYCGSAGVVGMAGRVSTVANITVNNVKITGTAQMNNVGGVAGSINNGTNVVFSNIEVNDLTIDNNASNGYGSGYGGIVGNSYSSNNMIMSECHVDNLKITQNGGNGAQVGGIIGNPCYQDLSLYNCSVKNTELHSQKNPVMSTTYNGVGGVIGNGYLNSLNIYGLDVEDTDIYSYALNAGGVNATYVSNKAEIHDVNLKNIKIHDELKANNMQYAYGGSTQYGSYYYGVNGAFGGQYYSGGVNATNINVEDCEVESSVESATILFGWIGGQSKFEDINIKNINIKNNEWTSYTKNGPGYSYQVSAGLTTYCSGDVTANNIKISDVEMVSDSGSNVGMIGYNNSSNNTYSNIEIDNVKLLSTNEHQLPGNYTALMNGVAGALTVNGGHIKNSEARIKGGVQCTAATINSAGYGNLTLNGVEIDEVVIENRGDYNSSQGCGFAAGIAGKTENFEMNGCTVTNIDVLGGRGDTGDLIVAGLVSCQTGSSSSNSITGCDIHDIVVENKTNDMTGGLFGCSYGCSIKSSNIENIEVTGKESSYTGRASMTGGIAGCMNASGISIVDSTIKNIESENENADMSGGLFGYIYNYGDLQVSNTEIENISIKNRGTAVDAYRNEYTGGFAGICNATIVFDNAKFKDIYVENKNAAATGGLYGMYTNGDAVISNVEIEDLTVNHDGNGSYKGATFTGGLIGMLTSGNFEVKGFEGDVPVESDETEGTETTDGDSEQDPEEPQEPELVHVKKPVVIKNISIQNNYGGSHGGLIGFAQNYVDIENAKIENITSNITVNQIYTGYNDFGGLVGSSEKYTRVVDTEINGNKTSANISSYMGGIVGFIHGVSQKPEVHDIVMNDVIVKQEVPNNLLNRQPRAGGITTLINYVDDNDDTTDDDTTFENIEINELAVIAKVYDENDNLRNLYGSEVGGLAAITKHITATTGTSEYTGDPVIITPATEGLLKVRNVTITNTSDAFEDGTKKEVYGVSHAGGLLGYGKIEADGITIDNLDVKGAENVGGIIGHADGSSSVVDSTVKNSNIASTAVLDTPNYHVGGLIGFVGEDSIINRATVDNCIIENEGFGNAGGLVGLVNRTNQYEKNVTINNSNVINCIHEDNDGNKTGITGKAHVGGLVGFGRFTASDVYSTGARTKITNCYIAGTKKANEYDVYGYIPTDVGAIVGNTLLNSVMNSIDVTDCIIENNKLKEKRLPEEEYNYTDVRNHVGLYAGFNANTENTNITNCTNSNVTVTMNEL